MTGTCGGSVWCYARPSAVTREGWYLRVESGVVVAVEAVLGHTVLGLVALTLAELRALAASSAPRGAR